MFAEKDQTALALLRRFNGVRMPNLQLSDAEVALVIDYLAQAGATR